MRVKSARAELLKTTTVIELLQFSKMDKLTVASRQQSRLSDVNRQRGLKNVIEPRKAVLPGKSKHDTKEPIRAGCYQPGLAAKAAKP